MGLLIYQNLLITFSLCYHLTLALNLTAGKKVRNQHNPGFTATHLTEESKINIIPGGKLLTQKNIMDFRGTF